MVMLANGFDWTSYTCDGWANTFGTSYPILDGGSSGGEAWDLFGDGYIPHHVVLDHNNEILYTNYGSNISGIMAAIELGLSYVPRDEDQDGIMDSTDNCFDVPNPDQLDLDGDGVAGDITLDGHLNILDVIGLVQMVLGGNQQQAISFLEDMLTPTQFTKLMSELPIDHLVSDKILVWPNPFNSSVSIHGSGYTEIYDMMGRKVNEMNLNGTYKWHAKNLPSGIYKVLNNKKSTTITLIK